MARIDSLIGKINKLAAKGKLDGLVKLSADPDEEVRATVAKAMGLIKTYDSGMALIPLLRDTSPFVRANAATSAGDIGAKHCLEYVKKLAFADSDPNVRIAAKEAFDKLKDRVI
ncbi:MAG: HEAT repeat domain-containing protein [Saccharofermentans sp.]|nr:HEAT repeat domain-containing protein [Saccharofermentans sp.]